MLTKDLLYSEKPAPEAFNETRHKKIYHGTFQFIEA